MAYGSIHTTAGSRKKTPVREEARRSGRRLASEVIRLLLIGHPRQFAFLRLRTGAQCRYRLLPEVVHPLACPKSVELLGEVANRNWQVRESNLDLGISVLGFTALGAA
jgi:hypothetical protein